MFQKYRKLFFIILFLIILLPVILLVESPIGVIPNDKAFAILSYSGSILGGLLTVLGVVLTLYESKKQFNEEKSLQYRPVFQYDIKKERVHFTQAGEIIFLFHDEMFINEHHYYLEEKIILKNVGRSEVDDLFIEISDVQLNANNLFDTNGFEISAYVLGNEYIKFVPMDGEVYLYIVFPCIKEKYFEIIPNDMNLLISGTINIYFKGLLTKKSYEQSLKFYLDVKRDGKKYVGRFYNTSIDLKNIDE